ncbi:TauD/TfdA family dioxygenase [Halobacteriovorax sp. HFRX-2_2]|uniref:TauD/TfdA family dioxygenase n=1 Tax=unclassified Halobacteriovorax TaxID=2639665 RepID=UPI00371953B6
MHEIDATSLEQNTLINTLKSVVEKGTTPYVIIRNATKLYNEDEWLDFLTNNCNLKRDCRQFDADSNFLLTDWWTISYNPEKDYSYAHSKTPQPFHNDNAWFQDPAEINFFIMKKQSQIGGEQKIILVNDFVNFLKENNPILLNSLLTTQVKIKKGTTDNEYNGTILNNSNGEFEMHWNYYRTDKSNSKIEQMCDDLFNLLKQLETTKIVQTVRLNTGDGLCIADMKLLHGRNSYHAERKDDRILLQSMWRL